MAPDTECDRPLPLRDRLAALDPLALPWLLGLNPDGAGTAPSDGRGLPPLLPMPPLVLLGVSDLAPVALVVQLSRKVGRLGATWTTSSRHSSVAPTTPTAVRTAEEHEEWCGRAAGGMHNVSCTDKDGMGV